MMEKLNAKFYGEIRKAKDGSIVLGDECMVFLFGDNAFAAVLPVYRSMCASLGADAEQLAAVDRMIERIYRWRAANPDRCKTPDAKGEVMLDQQ